MAEKILNTKIVVRNDTAQNWTTSDPVLKKGEPAFDSTNNLFKIGDGVKKWSELDPISKKDSEIEALLKNYLLGDDSKIKPEFIERDSFYKIEKTDDKTDAQCLATITSPKQGDIAVVIAVITGDKKEYTAYVYTGEDWSAMDGNYNADNVYLSNDITMAGNYTAVGNLTKSQNGTATFSTKGKSVSEALTEIFTKVLQPTVKQPSLTVTSTKAGSYEAGSKVTPAYTTTFNAGSYTYGPDTGVTATGYRITNNTTDEVLTTATGSFAELTISATTNFVMTASVGYSDGVAAKNNVGGTTSVKINSGMLSNIQSTAIKGYQQGYFIGTTTSKTATATSAIIRGLTSKKNANYAAGKVNFTVPKGAASVIIACPADKKGMTDVLNTTVNANMTTSFVKSTVKVAGADADTSSAYAKDYNVWIFSPAEAYGSTAALTITLG